MADVCVSSDDTQSHTESVALQQTFTIKGNLFARKAIDQVVFPTPVSDAPFFALVVPQAEWLHFMRAPVILSVSSVYNVTRGIDYVVSDPSKVVVIENRFIRIEDIYTSATVPWSDGEEVNVTLTLVANTYLLPLSKRPVLSVTEVLTEAAVSILVNSELVHLSPPYLEGNSAVASDYLLVTNYATSILQHVDEGRQVVKKDGDYYLTRKGVQIASLSVKYNAATLVAGADYFVTYHEDTDRVSIRLSSGYPVSSILTDVVGGIEYDYNENITVTYNYDSAVNRIQDTVWEEDVIGKRNILVKRSSPLQVSFQMDVPLYDVGKTAETDVLVRSALSQFESSIPLANKIYQSQIVSIAEGASSNVAKVDLPVKNARYYQSVFDYYPIDLTSSNLTYVAPYWDLVFPRLDLTKDFHLWGSRPFYEVKNSNNLAKVEGTYYFFGGLNFGVQQVEDLPLQWETVPDSLRCLSFLRADSSVRLMSNAAASGSDYSLGISLSSATTVYLAFDATACNMAGYYGSLTDKDPGYLVSTTVNPPMYDGESDMGINTGTRPRPAWIRNDKSWVDTGLVIYGGSGGVVPMRVFRKFFQSNTVSNPYHAFGGTQARSWVYGVANHVTFSAGTFTATCPAGHGLTGGDDIVVSKSSESLAISPGTSATVAVSSPTVFTFPGSIGGSTQTQWFIDWQRNMVVAGDNLFLPSVVPYGLIFADDVWSHYPLSFTDAAVSVDSGTIVIDTPSAHGLVSGQFVDITKSSVPATLAVNSLASPYPVEVVSSTRIRLYTVASAAVQGLCDFRVSVKATHVAEEYRLRFNPYYDKFTHVPTLPQRMVASMTVKDIPIDLEDYYVPTNQPVRLENVVINYREEIANSNTAK
jgi:hypothetical protein